MFGFFLRHCRQKRVMSKAGVFHQLKAFCSCRKFVYLVRVSGDAVVSVPVKTRFKTHDVFEMLNI